MDALRVLDEYTKAAFGFFIAIGDVQ